MRTIEMATGRLESVRSYHDGLIIEAEATLSQIKNNIRSILTVITDREWMAIIEELSPGVLEEMVLEKLQTQE